MRGRMLFSLILLVLCGRGFAQTMPSPAMMVANVNGETITLAELDAALSTNLPAIPLTVAQRRQLRSALLNDLIDDRLVKQFLAKNGPAVDPAEVEAQIKAFVEQLAKDHKSLADYLKQTGQTEAQLRADWTASIQLSNCVQREATDDKLRAYHAANRDFFDKVEVRVSQLTIRVTKGGLPGEVATAREKLQTIRSEIVAGRLDFATAARKYSHAVSGRTGGDLGFLLRRGPELEEPLMKAAFAMKPGDLSEVLETPSGLHLLLVTDRKPGTPTAVEKCTLVVLEAYTDDYRKDLIAKLRREAHIRITLP